MCSYDLFDRSKEILANSGLESSINIFKTYMELDKPSIDDNVSDVDRLERHVRQTLNISTIDFSIDVLRKMPKALRQDDIAREDDFKVTITYTKEDNKITLLNIERGNTENDLYGIAVDIGTTSVVVCLVNLITNEIVEKASSGNAQIKYGADVINRIVYAVKKDNIVEMRKAIVDETLNPLLDSIYKKSGEIGRAHV